VVGGGDAATAMILYLYNIAWVADWVMIAWGLLTHIRAAS